MSNKVVILDNGHGSDTPGKCSPDKSVQEWKETRILVNLLYDELIKQGFIVYKLVTEDNDVSLKKRTERANDICKKHKSDDTILISIHIDAAGNSSQWLNASGFSSRVSKNASEKSKLLAKLIWSKAIDNGLKGNRCVPDCKYVSQNLAICKNTICPAVLTENLFMDNKEDCKLILSKEGKSKIVQTHVDAVVEYFST